MNYLKLVEVEKCLKFKLKQKLATYLSLYA